MTVNRKVVVVVTACLLLMHYGCGDGEATKRRQMVGTWNQSPGWGGISVYTTYRSDGTFVSRVESEALSGSLVVGNGVVNGTWRLDDDLLTTVVTSSSVSRIAAGSTEADVLLHLDQMTCKVRNQKTGKEHTYVRVERPQ